MPREKKNLETPPETLPPTEENTALATPAEPENSLPTVKVEPPQPGPKKPSTFGHSLWRFIVFIFKLILTLAILCGIGAALYFGLPIVYDKYILPVQQNTSKLAALETQQAQTNQKFVDLQAQISDLQTQITTTAAQQTDQGQASAALETQMQTLEIEIKSHSQSIASLETLQDTLQSSNKENRLELERQVKLLKGMELLSRARLFLYQSNFGLAKEDLRSARNLLAEVQPSAPEPLGKELAEVVNRLDLTLANLPNFPVAASDDLDIAWQILLQGIPQTPPTPAIELPTATPKITEMPTPAATPEASSTPAPAPTATP